MKYNILPLLVLFILSACSRKPPVSEDDYIMDLRYAPLWGQTSICLPDEVQKTIVDDKGALYYGYISGGPFNGCYIALSAGLDSVEKGQVSQHLYSAKVSILLTSFQNNGLVFSTDIFALAPDLTNSPEDSCELSKGFRGYPHNDIIIVTLKNSSGKDTSVSPKFFIRSVYPVLFNRDNKSLTIDKRITVSLPAGIESVTENSLGKNNYYTFKFPPITIKAGTISRMAMAGDGQKATRTTYAMANHASPTLVGREEQPVRSVRSDRMTGNMPHNWASAEFIRLIRHSIALERGEELHLFEALPPTWTKPGMRTTLKGVFNEFGILDVDLVVSKDRKKADISVNLDSSDHHLPSSVVIHLDPLNGT